MASTLGDVAWEGFKLVFGLVSLAGAYTLAVVKNGALWARDTEEEKKELAAAQKKFWSLDQEPLPGFRHAFFETRDGTRLHYVVNERAESSTPKNVAIFIHGFPDSFVLWRHFLQSSSLQDHILVAVDLPGYGGSDSLPAYGPNELLETLTEFVIGVRELFLKDGKKMIIMTHDWGAIVGARLAAEAHVLADHFIITSGIIPALQHSNGRNGVLLAKQMLHTWIRSPFNIRLLKNGLSALGPLLGQFRHSFYIFVFHLPWPFNNTFATFGNYWFLRILHELGNGPRSMGNVFVRAMNPVEAGEAMASSTGPGIAQLEKLAPNGDRYGDSVGRRVKDRGMSEKIRIYRENLIFGKWNKSLETTAALFNISTDVSSTLSSSSSATLTNTAPQGALKAPTTVIMGQVDPAFEQRLAFDNARDYMVKGGQVIIIKGAGHWLPLEQVSRRALEKTLQWALHDGAEKETIPFEAMSDVRILEAL